VNIFSSRTYFGEGRLSSEELVLDVLREQERPLVALLVRDEVDDEHEDQVDDTFLDDCVHFDLLQSHFARLLQCLHVGPVYGRLRRATLLQDFFSIQHSTD